jgi:hypothetical protein
MGLQRISDLERDLQNALSVMARIEATKKKEKEEWNR